MPLHACRHIRKMRGGAQAHLIQTDDGHFYVVKFRNNPQHRRILVNESIASVFLRYLQIAAPETAVVDVSERFLLDNPDVAITLGDQRVAVEPGWQFGSRYPVDPDRAAVYDFVPDTLLTQVANLADFIGILVFDKWMANADGRQCVFFRARVQNGPTPDRSATGRLSFMASMIDHGFVFNGPHWDFPMSPVQGLYHRPLVYESVRSLDDFQPWLDRIVHFPETVIDEAYKQVPLAWLDNGESGALESLLECLIMRRQRLPELIESCRKGRPGIFPNWR